MEKYYDHYIYDSRQEFWDHVAINNDWSKLPGIKHNPNPTWAERRWIEQMRLTQSLLRGDGYFEQNYPLCLSLSSAMREWDQRNPEDAK